MKEQLRTLGSFFVSIATLILVCVAVVYWFRGLNWIFEKILPLNPIDFPPFVFSIIFTCFIVVTVIWASEKPMRKLVKEEKVTALADEQTVRPLRSVLRLEKNKQTSFHAVSELGKIGSPKAVEALCEALVDSEGDLRACVWNTLVSMGDTAVRELGLMLWDTRWERNKQARFHAASALGKIRSPNAVRELCSALTWVNDSEDDFFADGDMRACLCNTLVSIGSPAVKELCLRLNQKYHNRAYAAIALGEIGDARAIEALRKRLQRIDNSIHKFASWAFCEKLNFGYGVRRTTWDWETDSLRKALVKCGAAPVKPS